MHAVMSMKGARETRPVFIPENFASSMGGAQIIMKSSSKIYSAYSILEENQDNYLYSDEKLPIEIIICLKDEIRIDAILLKSSEMYSSIVGNFTIEGIFTLDSDKWFSLGNYTAENRFGWQ